MKVFFIFLSLSILSNITFAATYEVPVANQLKEFATFELKEFEKVIEGNQIRIKYILPSVLSGNEELVELQGKTPKSGNHFWMFGEKAIANCSEYLSAVSCSIYYDNLIIDKDKATEAIFGISKNVEEAKLRLEIMRSFSTDPVGIILY